jgi:integrase
VVWYVRLGRGQRVRIRAEFGTADFDAEYQAAVSRTPRPKKGKAVLGSLAWLIERYRETTDWTALSLATRHNRENHFKQVIKTAGHVAHGAITQAVIVAGRDRRAQTPAQARNYLDAMRGLFRWAYAAKLAKSDPTVGVVNPKRKKGQGFKPWNEEDVAAYEQRFPLGTKERVWLDVLLYTGPRRGDAARIGRQHIRQSPEGDILTFRTQKGQEEVEVSIPILPILARTLKAGPTGDLAFICGARGHPFTKESFGNAFSEAARKAGVNKSAHGVRKIAATRCADNGATVHQLMAIFGWRSASMAEVYTKEANRRRLAREAAHMLANESGKSMPSPCHEVRAPERKA